MTFGAIVQKNGLYALRILGSCGQFTAEELLNLAKLAQKFGKGCVTATSRGTMELEGISETELEEAVAAIQAAGLRLGGTGATVRAVVACKGTACRRGMYDVHALACRFDEQFYGLEVPKKFKIGVFGCINSLGKAMAQDVGIMPSYQARLSGAICRRSGRKQADTWQTYCRTVDAGTGYQGCCLYY